MEKFTVYDAFKTFELEDEEIEKQEALSKKFDLNNKKDEEDIVQHFIYNVKLVELNKTNYPDNILEIFDKHSSYNVTKDITIAENLIRANSNKLKNVLDFI